MARPKKHIPHLDSVFQSVQIGDCVVFKESNAIGFVPAKVIGLVGKKTFRLKGDDVREWNTLSKNIVKIPEEVYNEYRLRKLLTN